MPKQKTSVKKPTNMVERKKNEVTRKRTRSVTPSNNRANVNNGEEANTNFNQNATIADEAVGRRNAKRNKRKEIREEIAKASLKDDDQFIEMEVGQDTEFVSEESDEESNVVTFNKNRGRSATENQMEQQPDVETDEKDTEFNNMMRRNYELAGLVEAEAGEIIEDTNSANSSQPLMEKDSIINEAVDKFQEVFLKLGFLEKTEKMQQQLMESQRKLAEQNSRIGKTGENSQ